MSMCVGKRRDDVSILEIHDFINSLRFLSHQDSVNGIENLTAESLAIKPLTINELIRFWSQTGCLRLVVGKAAPIGTKQHEDK